MLVAMNLIPLRDVQGYTGDWVASQNKSIFFSSKPNGNQIPATVQVDIVHPDADSDTDRHTLFTQLGVKPCQDAEICRIIARMHAAVGFKPSKLTAEELLSHVVFLYKASWRPDDGTDLWFVTSTGSRCKGSELYICGNFQPNSAAANVNESLERGFRSSMTSILMLSQKITNGFPG